MKLPIYPSLMSENARKCPKVPGNILLNRSFCLGVAWVWPRQAGRSTSEGVEREQPEKAPAAQRRERGGLKGGQDRASDILIYNNKRDIDKSKH